LTNVIGELNKCRDLWACHL